MKLRIGRAGLTQIELMVVIAIIAILIALLLPAIQKVRESANRAHCRNNLKQIALGVHHYHDSWKILPYNSLTPSSVPPFAVYGPSTRSWSWLALLLPYVEQGPLHRQGNIPNNTLYDSRDVVATRVRLFLCPSDDVYDAPPNDLAADLGIWNPPFISAGYTSYKGVGGSNWAYGEARWRNIGPSGKIDGLADGDGLFYRSDFRAKKGFKAVTDGLSNTFMIGEAVPAKSRWCAWAYANGACGTCAIAPNATQLSGLDFDPWGWEDTYGFFSRHAGGLFFALADGSVSFVSNDIDLELYRALATISGGETAVLP